MTVVLSEAQTGAPSHTGGLGTLHEKSASVARLGNARSSLPAAVELQPPGGELGGRIPRAPLRIAFIGNSLARRCGIATFTADLQQAVSALPNVIETAIIAMCDPGGAYAWPPSVRLSIDQNDPGQYLAAADFINRGQFDVACLQHEFGIFGGAAGKLVLGLVARLKVPLITTFHTVLDRPSAAQRTVVDAILAASVRVIVMANKGRDILIETYGADPDKIMVIPHGIPDAPFEASAGAKRRLGFAGHKVILTFGLISPSKGIETMIEAMPAIIANVPDAVYVVIGATHPHLLRKSGEAYRQTLISRVRELGIEEHVVFLNRFADRPELLEHIAMCDVYVTPYLVASQLTSGTLAYSHGMGRPVISTPYWHAAELLADGSGMLVPFGDPLILENVVAKLLGDDLARRAMSRKAYAASRPTVWSQTAARYVDCFRAVARKAALRVVGGRNVPHASLAAPQVLRAAANHHPAAVCDRAGMVEHVAGGAAQRSTALTVTTQKQFASVREISS